MTTTKTDKYDELLTALRKCYGVPDVERESVRIVNDFFDDETGERVKIVEYKYRTTKNVHLSRTELKAIHSVLGKAAAELNGKKNV